MNSFVSKIPPCSLTRFFQYWLQFTAPFHKLQNKELEILAVILKKRFELAQMITDDDMVDSFLFSTEVRDQIIAEANESKANFQVVLSKLRKKNIILEGGKINKKFIPNLDKNSSRFDLMVIFDITHDTPQTTSVKS